MHLNYRNIYIVPIYFFAIQSAMYKIKFCIVVHIEYMYFVWAKIGIVYFCCILIL